MLPSRVLACLAMLSSTSLAAYVLEDDYFSGAGFFSKFSFFSDADPTHGFVQYQTKPAAISQGLISNSSSSAIMRVDSKNVVTNGRNSVRVTSNKAYNTGLVIIDIAHMPGGICGTWPAFWMLGPNWPNGGEIDIIEGVHDNALNAMALHTGAGCTVSDNTGFTGKMTSTSCVSPGADNSGCGIIAPPNATNSYGAGFNANRGGIYATEITSSAINIWFFARGTTVKRNLISSSPDPSTWGPPMARFTGGGCSIPNSFRNLQIIFDTTFCGDWAGNVWDGNPTCKAKAQTCQQYVGQNPGAFQGAYWDVRSLKVFKQGASKRDEELVLESREEGEARGVAVEFEA